MAKMTKSQILAALAEKTNISKKDVTTLVDALVELDYTEVKKSGEFAIAGLGKLVKVQRKARMGRTQPPARKLKSRLKPWLNSESLRPLKKPSSN